MMIISLLQFQGYFPSSMGMREEVSHHFLINKFKADSAVSPNYFLTLTSSSLKAGSSDRPNCIPSKSTDIIILAAVDLVPRLGCGQEKSLLV